MNNKEYKLLKKQIESHYRKAVDKAEAERSANLAALDRVWKLLQEIQPVAETPAECICSKCKEPKPLTKDHWYKDRNKQNGFQSWCKECVLEKRRSRKVATPKHVPIAQNTDAVYDCKGCGNTTEHLPEVCEKCSWGSFERRKKRIFKLTG